MNKREEYAIAVIVLIALLLSVASMVTGSIDIGIAAAIVAVVAVLYAIWVIHSEIQEGSPESSEYYEQSDHESRASRPVRQGRTTTRYTGSMSDSEPEYQEGRSTQSSSTRPSYYDTEQTPGGGPSIYVDEQESGALGGGAVMQEEEAASAERPGEATVEGEDQPPEPVTRQPGARKPARRPQDTRGQRGRKP